MEDLFFLRIKVIWSTSTHSFRLQLQMAASAHVFTVRVFRKLEISELGSYTLVSAQLLIPKGRNHPEERRAAFVLQSNPRLLELELLVRVRARGVTILTVRGALGFGEAYPQAATPSATQVLGSPGPHASHS